MSPKRLVEDSFDTVELEGIAGLDVGDLVDAGMRKGDAKTVHGLLTVK